MRCERLQDDYGITYYPHVKADCTVQRYMQHFEYTPPPYSPLAPLNETETFDTLERKLVLYAFLCGLIIRLIINRHETDCESDSTT